MVPELFLQLSDLVLLLRLAWSTEHASYLKFCRRHRGTERICEGATRGNESVQIPGHVEYIVGYARIVGLSLNSVQSFEVLNRPMADGEALCNGF